MCRGTCIHILCMTHPCLTIQRCCNSYLYLCALDTVAEQAIVVVVECNISLRYTVCRVFWIGDTQRGENSTYSKRKHTIYLSISIYLPHGYKTLVMLYEAIPISVSSSTRTLIAVIPPVNPVWKRKEIHLIAYSLVYELFSAHKMFNMNFSI